MFLDLMTKIALFIGVIGVLVTVHELGHFLVARLFRVKVLVFSIGFGKKIWGVQKGGTRYILSAIPLGGYVSMLEDEGSRDLKGLNGPMKETDIALNDASFFGKSSILLAGPAANILLAFFVYWATFIFGIDGPKTFIGEVEIGSIAERSGLETGDKLVSFGKHEVQTWEGFVHAFLDEVLSRRLVPIIALTANGAEKKINIDLEDISLDQMTDVGPFELLGFRPKRLEASARIKSVIAGSPAQSGNIKPGDMIKSANGLPITIWSDFVSVIQRNAGREIEIELDRNHSIVRTTVVPDSVREGTAIVGKIGVLVDLSDIWTREKYSVTRAAELALAKTMQMSVITLKFIWKLVRLEVSTRNLSGPIGIANYAGESAKIGFVELLKFMALVSISLAIINLMPIPMLDGGHLLYYSTEFVIGRPLPSGFRQAGLQVGLVILILLFLVATYNDIFRA